MPKKPKGEEHIHRINYLYKASQLISNTSVPLGQYYGKVLKTVAEKTPAKITLEQKRSICKSCHAILVLGKNATYRLKRKKGYKKNRKSHPTINITCTNCKKTKKFPTNPNFQLKNRETDNKNGSGNQNDEIVGTGSQLSPDHPNSETVKMFDSQGTRPHKPSSSLSKTYKKCSRIQGFWEYLF